MNHQDFQSCYHHWMGQQGLDLDELVQALTHHPTDVGYLKLITNKIINHFEGYNNARARLAKHDAHSFLAPTWGSTFENSFLWIGGCRPSLIIRLVYTLCGSQFDAHFADILQGIGYRNMGEISSSQLRSIFDLQAKTMKEEDKLSFQMAGLQEMKLDKALDSHALDMYNVLMEADKLRLNTLKGMIDILTPLQAAELLVAAKKLHLAIHEWSQIRDLRMGITHLLNINNPSSSSDPPPEPSDPPPEPSEPPPEP